MINKWREGRSRTQGLVADVDVNVCLSHPHLLALEVESDRRTLLVHGVPLDVAGTGRSFDCVLQELIWRSSPVQQIAEALLEPVSVVVDRCGIVHHAALSKCSTVHGGKPFLFTYRLV